MVAKGMIQPLGAKVLVQRIKAEEKTAGGIVLPDSAKEKPQQGTVIAVGPGRVLDNGERSPIQIKNDDKVLFTPYGGTEVEMNREKYLILDESDVLAVIG